MQGLTVLLDVKLGMCGQYCRPRLPLCCRPEAKNILKGESQGPKHNSRGKNLPQQVWPSPSGSSSLRGCGVGPHIPGPRGSLGKCSRFRFSTAVSQTVGDQEIIASLISPPPSVLGGDLKGIKGLEGLHNTTLTLCHFQVQVLRVIKKKKKPTRWLEALTIYFKKSVTRNATKTISLCLHFPEVGRLHCLSSCMHICVYSHTS